MNHHDVDRVAPSLGTDTLDFIVAAIRRLPETQQAVVIRRLGNPRPDPELAVILAAWPKLAESTRRAILAMIHSQPRRYD